MNTMRTALNALRRRLGDSDQRGQALPLFVLMLFVIMGSVAIVTDVSWFWTTQQKMQRAADAAALAGAIYLPGDTTSAYRTAREAAVENGYSDGIGGVSVTPLQDALNRRRLSVTVSGPTGTFFARIFGFDQTTISAKSKGEYILPVPMGSPQNYYGVGYYVGPTTTTTNNTVNADTDWNPAVGVVAGGQWTSPGSVALNDNVWASEDTTTQAQQWNMFALQPDIQNDPTTVIDGLQVRLTDVTLTGSGTATNCQMRIETSWNAGTNWSTVVNSGLLSTTVGTYTLGTAGSTATWGGHTWTRADFTDTNFRVRLTWIDGNSNCAATQSVRIDLLDVRAYFHYTTTSTNTTWGLAPVISPTGGTLAPQNFWAAMQSQGAPSIQGDAYMTKYDIRKGTANAAYEYDTYYNYGVDIPAGASGGQVWIFDPGFCDTGTAYGLGENWTVGGTNGNSLEEPASAYYEVWDTRGTPYDINDDVRKDVTTDDNAYRRLKLTDVRSPGSNTTDSGGTAIASCAGLSSHFGWVQIAGGLPGNTTYRVHTYSTDKSSLTDQDDTTALNSFAIWTTATGGTPRVYGIGAMEAYVKLPAAQVSQFYLAQIDAVHAGKTLVIELWDPGDTGNLSGTLEILAPNSSTYAPTGFTWTSLKGTAASTSTCDGRTSGGTVTNVVTSLGSSGGSQFNGCWLTIEIALPATYSAPHPSSDTVTTEAGWWKIRYTMGAGTNPSTDLTTWKVSIRGSPVHLVP